MAQGPLSPRNGMGLAPRNFADSDIWHSFLQTPAAYIPAIIAGLLVLTALLAPLVAPFDPYNPASLNLHDAGIPPAWAQGGNSKYVLGTDDQGRDMLSAIVYGVRVSLFVSIAAVSMAVLIGVSIGLVSGYAGGLTDAIMMRIADVQLSFPSILIALLVDGILRIALPANARDDLSFSVIVIAIALAGWVRYARTVRSAVIREKSRDYVLAAQIIGLDKVTILLRHILPNVLGPVVVIATMHLALAIILEATLSFLGVGLPPTTPSLGTLIRTGSEYLVAGEWWITIFPGLILVTLAMSVNMLGDWLRDALNPRLK